MPKNLFYKNDEKGSLTIEAALILPVFVFAFFLLLFVVKTVYIQAVLDHAVRETGQEIASLAYPLNLLNEWEDENAAEGLMVEAGKIEWLRTLYFGLQDDGGRKWVSSTLDKHLAQLSLNQENIQIEFIHLPQSNFGYELQKVTKTLLNGDLLSGRDYGKDDVFIQASYTLTMPLPFLAGKQVILKSATVEKAWLQGGDANYTDRTEKGIFEKIKEKSYKTVYITRTGEKYHVASCRYLKKSKIPMKLEEAVKNYEACKVCCPSGN